MPKVENAMRPSSHKSGTENHVSAIIHEGLKKGGILGGVVLKIGILDNDESGPGKGYASAESGSFALVDGVAGCLNFGV
jgi:hypothetical protein